MGNTVHEADNESRRGRLILAGLYLTLLGQLHVELSYKLNA